MSTPSAVSSASNHRIARQGAVAIRLALVIGILAGGFGLIQFFLFDFAHASDLWVSRYARVAALLNIVVAGALGVFSLVNRNITSATDAAVRRYIVTLELVLVVGLLFSLGHIHLAGSHNSLIPMVLIGYLVLMRWFAPQRAVPYYIAAAIVGGITMVTLEFTGVLPYAPILNRSAALRPVFLDWRWVVGDVLMFTAMTTPCVFVFGRLRENFEEREADLEERVAEKTAALRVSYAQIEEQLREVNAANHALAEAEHVRAAQAASLGSLREKLNHVTHTASLVEISGSVAHQMRQPLAGILANTQAAARMLDAPNPDFVEIRAALDDVIDDERRAEAVIQAIRKLVREAPLVRERVELDRVVEDVLKVLAERVATQKVTLESHAGGLDAVVMGDAIQLSQVVLNLVTNALDALVGANGSGHILVMVRREGAELILSVEDNGPGFSRNILDEAFEPWVTTRPDGMGLGLALVRRIVTALEGSVVAKNRPHGGARVEMRLLAAAA